MKPTLQEVADAAGVSLSTASKVLNGRPDVSEGAQQRVSTAAQNLGYRARPRAHAPRTTLAILFDTLMSPYALQILDGAVHAAMRAGYELVTLCMSDDEDDECPVLSHDWVDRLGSRGYAGLIAVTSPVTDEHAQWCADAGLALVVIDPATAVSDSVVTISATNWEGGKTATRHLLDLGHRRIGLIAGTRTSVVATERLQGYRTALEECGIDFDPDLVRGNGFDPESGHAGADDLLGLDARPTAVFATSDAAAIGVLRSASEHGLVVPRDLSVVGFDDTLMAQWASTALTTVRQPLPSMGQVAVERTIALAKDAKLFSHPFQLKTQLIVRESTTHPGVEPGGRGEGTV